VIRSFTNPPRRENCLPACQRRSTWLAVHSDLNIGTSRHSATLQHRDAMISLLAILGGLLALYLIRFPYKLARNYIIARKTGLPIIVVPIDQNHPLWMVTCVPLRPTFKVSIHCPTLDVRPLLTLAPEISPTMHIRKTRSLYLRMGVPQRPQAISETRQARQRQDFLSGHMRTCGDQHM
jgi:hypothetical protein